MEKKKVSDSQKRATAKYEQKVYDKTLVRLPKGTLDKIRATGETTNGFIKQAIIEKLQSLEYDPDNEPINEPFTDAPEE